MQVIIILKIIMEGKIAKLFTGKKASCAFTSTSTIKASKEGKKYSKNAIDNVLRKIPASVLHKPIRKKFPRRVVSVPTLNHQFGADLIEIKYPKSNYNKKYIIAVVDHFSRSAWLEGLKTKTANEVSAAIKRIFKRTKRTCQLFQTDDGKEFINSKLKGYFDTLGIKHFVTSSSTKCCINERFNRTLGQRIARYLTHAKSKRFIHKLKDFESQYNNSYHSSIKMTPNQVTENNASQVWSNIYTRKNKKLDIPYKDMFMKGQNVLIPRKKGLFEKGYAQNYGETIYKIHEVKHTKPPTYVLSSVDGNIIKGGWYKQELVKVPNETEHADL